MKKTAGILLVIVMVVFSAGSGICAETGDVGGSVDSEKSDKTIDTANATNFQLGDVNLGLGLKTWFNKYEMKDKISATDSVITQEEEGRNTSDSALMAGPSLQLSFKKIFGGISYLMSLSDYEDDGGGSFERKDMDLMVGYMVHERIGLLVGYKKVDLDYSSGISGTRSGPALGVAFNYPVQMTALKNPLVLTLNGNYFPTLEIEQGPLDLDGDGYSVELGAAYPVANWVFSLGYKIQHFEGEQDLVDSGIFVNIDLDEDYSGLILNAVYRF